MYGGKITSTTRMQAKEKEQQQQQQQQNTTIACTHKKTHTFCWQLGQLKAYAVHATG